MLSTEEWLSKNWPYFAVEISQTLAIQGLRKAVDNGRNTTTGIDEIYDCQIENAGMTDSSGFLKVRRFVFFSNPA